TGRRQRDPGFSVDAGGTLLSGVDAGAGTALQPRHLVRVSDARPQPPGVQPVAAGSGVDAGDSGRRRLRRHSRGRDPGISEMTFDAKIPVGPLEDKWDRHKADLRLVSPANKRKFHVIVVGS